MANSNFKEFIESNEKLIKDIERDPHVCTDVSRMIAALRGLNATIGEVGKRMDEIGRAKPRQEVTGQ